MPEGQALPDDAAPPAAVPVPVLDQAAAQAIVDRTMARFFEGRHARVEDFVDRTFSLRGALAVHRRALGWDLLRAPANVALCGPTAALMLAGAAARGVGARRVAQWLASRNLFLETAVAREIAWRLHVELLELPIDQGERESRRDALAELILADPAVGALLEPALLRIGEAARGEDLRRRLTENLAVYAGSRAAAAEIASTLVTLGIGAATVKQATPTALTLGPALAGVLAHKIAVAGFPLGAGLGGVWYGAFGASASTGLVLASTGAVLAAAAALSAVAGVVADPVQRRLGMHRRRLHRFLDSLERQMAGDAEAGFRVRDHYVARLIDLVDLVRLAGRTLG